MKISKRRLRRIISEERGDYPMSQFSNLEPGEVTPKRRPELQAILDAANAAHGVVPYRVLKNFFWELNSSYAKSRKIMEKKSMKITKKQLQRIIKESLIDMIYQKPALGRRTKAILTKVKELIPADVQANDDKLDRFLRDAADGRHGLELNDLLYDVWDAGEIGVEDIVDYWSEI